jgi:hypothetical protein
VGCVGLDLFRKNEIRVTRAMGMDGAWLEIGRVTTGNFAAWGGAGAITGFLDVIESTGLLQSK